MTSNPCRASRASFGLPGSKPFVVVLLVMGLLAGSSLVASADPPDSGGSGALSSRLVPIGGLARVPDTATPLGPLSAGRTLRLGVSLRVAHPAALQAYATAVSTPGSPTYHHYLTPSEFAAKFGPTSASITRVEAALGAAGITPGTISRNHLVLPFSATVGHVEAAFQTHVLAYHLANGNLGWAPTAAPRLSSSLVGDVGGVVGLDNLAAAHSSLESASGAAAAGVSTTTPAARAVSTAPTACHAARSAARAGSGWTDSDLAKAYGLNALFAAGDVARGQTIAIFELEPYRVRDISVFDDCYFGVSHTAALSSVSVDGFNLVGPGSGESALDIEDLSALAPAARLIVYEAPNTTFGAIDNYNAMVSADRANIISTSWGECESALETGSPGAQQLENSIFEEAAAQGQTVVAASGDTGSDDCASTPFSSTVSVKPYLSVDDPASQPFVLAVGGTSLASDVQPLGPRAETVWNDASNGGGSGGGLSATWPEPTWQLNSGVAGVASAGRREVPDVSAAADQLHGITVYSSGFEEPASSSVTLSPKSRPADARPADALSDAGWSTLGGTSSSAPIWAGILADIAASGSTGSSCAQLPVTAGGYDLGFVSPELYSVAQAAYSTSFHDVTVGDNDVFGLGGGYVATPGYNLAAGLGSPIVTNVSGAPGLAANLCAVAAGGVATASTRPTVSGLSPAFGSAAGGSTVTIQLASAVPSGAAVRVQFGATPASVLNVSGSTVVVKAPTAQLAVGSASFAGAGPAEVAVFLTAAGGTLSSYPGLASIFDYVSTTPAGNVTPTVSGTAPYAGNVAGGGEVTVFGSGFADGPISVSVGGVAAGSVVVLNDHQLRFTVPPETSATQCRSGAGFDPASACQTEVVVSGASGASPIAPILPALSGRIVFSPQGVIDPRPGTEVAPGATEYVYSPTPVITKITPNPGGASGFSPVTIVGHGFSLDTFEWVNFGPAFSSSSEQVEIRYISSSRIKIDPPPARSSGGRPLAGGVSVQTTGGLSQVRKFSYAGIPSVARLSKAVGPTGGGTTILVDGHGLAAVTSVRFVSELTAARGHTVTSRRVSRQRSASVWVVTPPGLPGPVDVEPCTATGCASRDSAVDTFTYLSAVHRAT